MLKNINTRSSQQMNLETGKHAKLQTYGVQVNYSGRKGSLNLIRPDSFAVIF